MNEKQKREKGLFGAILLVLILVLIYSGVQILESTVFFKQEKQTSYVPSETKTITKNGVKYFPKQDMTVIMVVGVDQSGKVADSGSYTNPGAADVVMLVVFDESEKSTRILALNRDTMVDMPILGVGGKPAGKIHAQLALSHTYGDGLQESCVNTRETVSELLSGLYIDYYIAMNMDAIAVMNDAVGGVPVTVTDDFSAIDSTITMGDITLNGAQATNYVRSRSGVGDELNVSRMERQRNYMESFMKVLKKKASSNSDFVLSVYEEVEEYVVTDCTSTVWLSLVDKYHSYELEETITPKGENVHGSEYMEYYLDEEALEDLVLRLFYTPIE